MAHMKSFSLASVARLRVVVGDGTMRKCAIGGYHGGRFPSLNKGKGLQFRGRGGFRVQGLAPLVVFGCSRTFQ